MSPSFAAALFIFIVAAGLHTYRNVATQGMHDAFGSRMNNAQYLWVHTQDSCRSRFLMILSLESERKRRQSKDFVDAAISKINEWATIR
jgi:hypothetical protein